MSAIPKIIHFCWFGKGAKPKLVQKCINSWRKHLPDYQLIEWNESNFDINSNQYVKEAYEAKKYAFVSDFVRLHALYKHGGVYMDTDVEVLKSLNPLLKDKMFTGFEDGQFLQSGTIGAIKGHELIEEFMKYYYTKRFKKLDGTYDMTTNTNIMTSLCLPFGLKTDGSKQILSNGTVVYPRTYFSPYDYINGENHITEQSYTIHHFAQTWLPANVRLRSNLKRMVSRIAGPKTISAIRKAIQSK
ncbi:glycosyl transferase [Metabacillus sp. GX 13764]|uniref:glycosyltransferase family 32 protein n=1 Tax=Metabacillus kandeliae TaxID=2900151 RepID=UPI001E2D9BB3|nr:glycosyltransferase [Metabacillus kandeliae]MCD7033142.1 glycosyl transferase [Metabacillus kandeliae]